MKQPIKQNINVKKTLKKVKDKKVKTPEELDGSGLEKIFRENFLEKLGVKYQQQFEAKSIGRFYDFYLPDSRVLIEIDGTYFHVDPRKYESPINYMQKRNKRVDKLKDAWALMNGYLLLRFWEDDIRKKPNEVMDILVERLNIQNKKVLILDSKKDGSFFIKKNK